MLAFTLIALICLGSACALVSAIRGAKSGYEDEQGFYEDEQGFHLEEIASDIPSRLDSPKKEAAAPARSKVTVGKKPFRTGPAAA